MSAEQQDGAAEQTALSPAEQASVEVGQRGLSEVAPAAPAATPADRPEWLPEKFVKDGKPDYEALARSYSELERARSAPAEQQRETPAAETPAPKIGADGKIAKEEAPAEAPANPLTTAMEAAKAEWASTQVVSDETVAQLEAAGIPREIFNVYLEGVKAQSAASLTTIHGYVGGEAEYSAMANWAGQTLTDAELDAFNASLENPQARENAVRGLYARYSQARPSEGQLIAAPGGQSNAGDTYSSRDDLVRDQRDPRYGTDPAFRQQVVDKLQRSQRSGFQVVQRSLFEKQVYTK